MNNRFEQLWQQVNLQECDCGCNPDEFLRLRFAELIVAECVRAVESNRKEPREGYNTYNMGTFEAVDSIKQYFGIEE